MALIVRTSDNGKYEILAGHNRVYAAGQARLEKVPAVVKVNLSDEDAELYVVETNVQRGFSNLKISERAFVVAFRYNNTNHSLNYGNLSPQNYIFQSFCGDFFSVILMVISIICLMNANAKV